MRSTSPLLRSAYPEYKSPYGPKYHYQPHVAGITAKRFTSFGVNAGMFGGVALFTVIFIASGIPRLQDDVLFKLPIVGGTLESYLRKKIPASDSPF
ncbi:ubiquinol-cytochrome-c reductase complex subunit-domain-containing protein [Cladorrhinum samala]|uniref:Ubiquinol-cytochrome-c reductase complex subunit-domain-containing protein n=1 Tax=Cladorrhinum samala TaxID=585594 RepID=A0AAV9HZ67_9PEZI|nr:ubiquinol-cytochrome-c reductase complex subunit-domain-containing protein [Cladorrhinum samala]